MEFEKSASWPDDDFGVPTVDPNISVSVLSEEVPTLTVATVVGMTLIILIAIIVVFVLGVLIDCRQQRLLDEKLGAAKRLKNPRAATTPPEDDSASIANNMEEPGTSAPPAETLRDIP